MIGIAEWLKSWQPDLDEVRALARAAEYMQAMPAWEKTNNYSPSF